MTALTSKRCYIVKREKKLGKSMISNAIIRKYKNIKANLKLTNMENTFQLIFSLKSVRRK